MVRNIESNEFDPIVWSSYASATSPPSPIPTPFFSTVWMSFTQYLANNAQTQLSHGQHKFEIMGQTEEEDNVQLNSWSLLNTITIQLATFRLWVSCKRAVAE